MSTVKIKTEPAAAAAVDVQVKLEPCLSTSDIKLEQQSSDIDTKVEHDSEADSDVKSEDKDDDSEDTDQPQFTITPKNQRRFICEYIGCGCSFNSICRLGRHQHEHRLQTELNTHGNNYTLTRQSLTDRWPCPIPDCEATYRAVGSIFKHVRRVHSNTVRHQHQTPTNVTRQKHYFVAVDSFYVNSVRCGYHNTTNVFICHECRLVPEFLLTHLQQKHGYDEKSIDNSVLPESAVNAAADPNINQHTSNPHLASAIGRLYRQQHPDIVRGWLCVTSDCGYCGSATNNKNHHKNNAHQGELLLTIPALVLRLAYAKSHSCYFFITRIDQGSGVAKASSRNRVNRHKLDYNHDGLDSEDESEDDASQNENLNAPDRKRQWKCEYPDCRRVFNSTSKLYIHRRDHRLEIAINVYGKTVTLARQSSDDRWACPVPECETTYKTVEGTHKHIQKVHSTSMRQKRTNTDGDSQQQQQHSIKRKPPTIYYLKVDAFYVIDTRCGYHNPTGVFICYACRLVPECLLTHLQQKHEYDEKSIDSAFLPESAVNANADPNVNQHTGNTLLAAALREPSQPQHPDILQGWLCITSNCGYCGFTRRLRYQHQHKEHRGEQLVTVPALVLRLLYGKAQVMLFFITRLDTVTNNISPNSNASEYNSKCVGEEDGSDELVLSDYSDEDDIY